MTRKFNSQGTLSAYHVHPDEVKKGDRYGYKIVACVWESWNGWCAFSGPTDWTDERVAKYGDEIPEEAANLLFPTLANLQFMYSNC